MDRVSVIRALEGEVGLLSLQIEFLRLDTGTKSVTENLCPLGPTSVLEL